ncbi:MAG: response regulator transcription factor [Deltaproteobacteria bacterium]|nr:response regulator transcription factor [Deltaproteobacteria bacterium]
MPGQAESALNAIRAVYAWEQPREPWLDGILDTLSGFVSLGEGATLAEWVVDDASNASLTWFGQRGGSHDYAAAAHGMQQAVPPSFIDRIGYAPGHLGPMMAPGSMAETADEPQHAMDVAARLLRETTGLADVLGASVAWRPRRGLWVAAPTRGALWTRAQVALLRHVMAHLRCALRLRNTAETAAEAVLDAGSGRILHAEGSAQASTARDRLRAQARSLDRARARAGAQDAEAAMRALTGLVQGTWTLVDAFESDGRHLVVARRNATLAPSAARLTRREREVALLAATGTSNKLIAYELGLAPSTVATHLQKAMRKLGVDTRVGLCRLMRQVWRRHA